MDPDRFQMKDLKRRMATNERHIDAIKVVQKETRRAVRELSTAGLEDLTETVTRNEQLLDGVIESLDEHILRQVKLIADLEATVADISNYLIARFGYHRSSA